MFDGHCVAGSYVRFRPDSRVGGCPTASIFLLFVQKKGTKEKDTQRLDLVLLGSPQCSHATGAAQLAQCYAFNALKQCSL